MGAKLPKGALLTGPPGVGKTLLAKAVAGEAGVHFVQCSGSDFVEKFVGMGAKRVRELFREAKSHSPCIIFIDEIDAIAKKRDYQYVGNQERDTTLNQLLVEMDGFDSDSNVLVLAATNLPDTLDPAILRAGRFDRRIQVSLPDINSRVQIFKVYLKELKLNPELDLETYAKRLATLTPYFSGADIANLCNEAAIISVRSKLEEIGFKQFELASERVIAGLEKNNTLSEEEQWTVAIHESGHAVVGWFLEGADPLLKVTIQPRSKGALGYAQYLPNENFIDKEQEYKEKICTLLGGRIAEQLIIGKITTGAGNDLEKVYEKAYEMVTKLGMSDLGTISFKYQDKKNYSDPSNKEADQQVQKIIHECTEKTKLIVTEHLEKINLLAQKLKEMKSINLKELNEVLGKRPFQPKSNFKQYLEFES